MSHFTYVIRSFFSSGAIRSSLFLASLTVLVSILPAQENIHHHEGTHGSVAVAVIREDTIVVAADSRTTTDGAVNPDTTCKMTVVDTVVFAVTGLLKGNLWAVGMLEYARSVLKGPENLRYKLQEFQSGASRLMTSWLNVRGDYDSLLLSPYYRNSHSVRTMFCFFAEGRPVVVKIEFAPSIAGKNFKIGGVYDGGARKPGEILWIGEYRRTQELLLKDSLFAAMISRKGAVEAAQALIEKQAQFTPLVVGGTIDIALVTPKYAGWVKRKQTCR